MNFRSPKKIERIEAAIGVERSIHKCQRIYPAGCLELCVHRGSFPDDLGTFPSDMATFPTDRGSFFCSGKLPRRLGKLPFRHPNLPGRQGKLLFTPGSFPRRLGKLPFCPGNPDGSPAKLRGWHLKRARHRACAPSRQQGQVQIATKLRCAVQHAGLAAHQQVGDPMSPDRRKGFADRARDQGSLPSRGSDARAERSLPNAPEESSDTSRPGAPICGRPCIHLTE